MNMPQEPGVNVVSTNTEPARISPFNRVLRTVIQVLIAVAIAVPTAAALFDISAELSGKITASTGALVIILSAIQNGFNQAQANKP